MHMRSNLRSGTPLGKERHVGNKPDRQACYALANALEQYDAPERRGSPDGGAEVGEVNGVGVALGVALLLVLNEFTRGTQHAWHARCAAWAERSSPIRWLRTRFARDWERRAASEHDPRLREKMLAYAAEWRRKAAQ